MQQRMEHFRQLLDKGDITFDRAIESEDINLIAASLKENEFMDAIERGVAALLAFHNRAEPEEFDEVIEEEPTDELNIFTELRTSANGLPPLTNNLSAFSQSLLVRGSTRTNISTMERLSGRLDKHSNNIAVEIIKDMQLATYYPPDSRDSIDSSELAQVANELISAIRTARATAAAKPPAETTAED